MLIQFEKSNKETSFGICNGCGKKEKKKLKIEKIIWKWMTWLSWFSNWLYYREQVYFIEKDSIWSAPDKMREEGAVWNKREIERRIGMKGRKRKKLVLRRRGPDPATHLHIVRVITSKKVSTMVAGRFVVQGKAEREQLGEWGMVEEERLTSFSALLNYEKWGNSLTVILSRLFVHWRIHYKKKKKKQS